MRQLGQDSFPGEGATLFGRLDDPEQRARWNDALVRMVGDSSASYLEFAAYHHFAAGERQAAREFADRALAAGAAPAKATLRIVAATIAPTDRADVFHSLITVSSSSCTHIHSSPVSPSHQGRFALERVKGVCPAR